MPARAELVLGAHLVPAADAGGDARARVGDRQHLEQLLDGSVLAVAAVQADERGVDLDLAQPLDEVVTDVDRAHLVPEALERVLDARAGAQRDLALQRAPALEHRDAAHGDGAHARAACAARAPRRAADRPRAGRASGGAAAGRERRR